jgi:catechol 2,3-dioxygenase-like lactoylglutathione lyase family enzyme
VIDEGEGAFYGPKIDIHARDAIGREWQLTTIQVDFNLPERFDVSYVGEDGAKHRPFMVHRALFGSIERFFAVMVESFNGAFPTWLAPVQAVVVPVAAEFDGYADEVAAAAAGAGVRVEVDASDAGLGKKIREAQTSKIPYTLVVGESERSARHRRGAALPGRPAQGRPARRVRRGARRRDRRQTPRTGLTDPDPSGLTPWAAVGHTDRCRRPVSSCLEGSEKMGADGTVGFVGLHHVQLAIPAGGEDRCRGFWRDTLGMEELEKPPTLAARGGCWFRGGGVKVHLGVEEGFEPARKAHPGILVVGLAALATRLEAAGVAVRWDDDLPGHDRFYADDPFGNRLEFLEPR